MIIYEGGEDKKAYESAVSELKFCVPKMLPSRDLKFEAQTTENGPTNQWALVLTKMQIFIDADFKYGSFQFSVSYHALD